MKVIGIFLVTVALMAGVVGCAGPAEEEKEGEEVRYELTIDSTAGGSVTKPGEGRFTYDGGTVVVLVATSEAGYGFDGWTGDAGAVYDAGKRVTTITMNGGYSITANFSKRIDYPYSGRVRLHAGSDADDYTWFSFVPDDLRESSTYYLLLTAEGGDLDYETTIEGVRGLTTFFSSNPSLSDLICIGVAIPRGEEEQEEPGQYAVAMPAGVFSDAIDKKFYRPDLKVSAIIEDFTGELESYGITVHDKVLMWGFSNSAFFAHRYCFLHPERVKAVAIGGYTSLTMGMDTYSNRRLNWPLGTSDFSTLTSVDFDVDAYNSIPKFIFIGEEDTGSYQPTVFSPESCWNQDVFTLDQCQILYDIADTDPIRVQNQAVIMSDNGDNITFKIYPGIGHQFCSEMQYDAGVFFANIINE